MSNYYDYARPKGKRAPHTFSKVEMCDNYFGNHIYGVKFPDGNVLRKEDCEFTELPWKSVLQETYTAFSKIVNRIEVLDENGEYSMLLADLAVRDKNDVNGEMLPLSILFEKLIREL
jgi:hypothetical protein